MITIKSALFKFMPRKLLFKIKKWHYLEKIKGAVEDYEEDISMVKNFLHKGDHALDIGANIGIYTKYLSQFVGLSGKVYSFEPIPETFYYLENNIKKLRLNNVISLNIAVSDSSGKVLMEIPQYQNAGDNYYEAKIVTSASENLISYMVECDTLDNLYAKYNFQPAFIKCDVEGFEWNVFQCGGILLKECQPILLIEINPDLKQPDTKTSELLKFLKNYGYVTYIKNDGKLKERNNEKKVNYYFLLPKHVDKLKTDGLIQS